MTWRESLWRSKIIGFPVCWFGVREWRCNNATCLWVRSSWLRRVECFVGLCDGFRWYILLWSIFFGIRVGEWRCKNGGLWVSVVWLRGGGLLVGSCDGVRCYIFFWSIFFGIGK